ncbi:hypothetical protein E2562_003069 [Oryza meyeriana var. granulata]|uniref:Uncharacterized protein n=1 Tax=Oryza meyeriana var. granulata TaxID=110450 RepID=A0A6G1E925_9ORYZ|nr:hypothetical protein E2562_003069 [Oryza meyeriana var. granulata]
MIRFCYFPKFYNAILRLPLLEFAASLEGDGRGSRTAGRRRAVRQQVWEEGRAGATALEMSGSRGEGWLRDWTDAESLLLHRSLHR